MRPEGLSRRQTAGRASRQSRDARYGRCCGSGKHSHGAGRKGERARERGWKRQEAEAVRAMVLDDGTGCCKARPRRTHAHTRAHTNGERERAREAGTLSQHKGSAFLTVPLFSPPRSSLSRTLSPQQQRALCPSFLFLSRCRSLPRLLSLSLSPHKTHVRGVRIKQVRRRAKGRPAVAHCRRAPRDTHTHTRTHTHTQRGVYGGSRRR